ncbi:MAG: IS1634 family transposase, partial [Candidatus Diapherotrites archaeon]
KVVEAVRESGLTARTAKTWGPALVFGRLWERQGLPEILGQLAQGRRFEFDVERAAFALALQRLCAPGSDLQGSGWVQTVAAPGLETLALQHFYRTTAFLATVRQGLERKLFFRDRNLFNQALDLVFIDTTSLYCYRDEETALRRRGYSRDRRPELPQLVLCVAVDSQGWPIAWEVFPGNTADTAALRQVVEKLRERFKIGKVAVVADRGMMSKETLKLLAGHKTAPFDYVLGCKLRRSKEVREEVLSRGGRYRKVAENLEVKEVRVQDRRYVVCRNPKEAKKDALAREALVEKLKATLAREGEKGLMGNRGFARFLKTAKGSVHLDEAALAADARLDGKFVLTTNTDLPADQVALTYKSLWRVERTFREQKSTLQVRPLYHQRDDTCLGHIVASFLALRLEVDLQRRLEEQGAEVSWPDLMRDLQQVQAVTVELDGHSYQLRTDLKGAAYQAFAAAGVRPPPTVSPLEPQPQPDSLSSSA